MPRIFWPFRIPQSLEKMGHTAKGKEIPLGQKSCRTKIPRIFRIVIPNFAPNFAPDFLRSFCASFRGKRRPEEIHPKSLPFLNAKLPGKSEEKIQKNFLESGQSKIPEQEIGRGEKAPTPTLSALVRK